MWFRQHSLSTKIVTVMVAVILCMEMLTMFLLNVTVRNRLQYYILQDNQSRLEQISNQLNDAFFQIGEDMVQAYEKLSTLLANKGNDAVQWTNLSIQFAECYTDMIRSMETYRYIHSAMLLLEDGRYYYNSTNYQHKLLNENLFQKLTEDMTIEDLLNWSEPLEESYYFVEDLGGKIVSLVLPIMSNYRVTALMVVNVEVSEIAKFLDENGYEEFLMLTTPEGCNIYSEDSFSRLDSRDQDLLTLSEGELGSQTEASLVFTQDLPINGWRMSMLYAKSKLQYSFTSWLSTIVIEVVFLGVALAAVSTYLIHEVTNPIKRLAAEIRQSERTGKLEKISFRPKTYDEVGVLILAYNQLILKTRSSMEKVEAEQKISKKAYLQALQMQINPHFLYNTMDALRYLVQMQAPEALEMAEAISEFYKRSLIGSEDMTNLEQEILHIKYYLQIMKLRYKSKFDYEIQVDASLHDNVMIQLSLQPIVENAIYHGVKEKRGKNLIRISAYRRDDAMVVEVYDNGNGMTEETLRKVKERLWWDDQIRSGAHIGLANVHQRIQLRFGSRYGLELESVPQEYTICRVVLPIRSMEDHRRNGEEVKDV